MSRQYLSQLVNESVCQPDIVIVSQCVNVSFVYQCFLHLITQSGNKADRQTVSPLVIHSVRYNVGQEDPHFAKLISLLFYWNIFGITISTLWGGHFII